MYLRDPACDVVTWKSWVNTPLHDLPSEFGEALHVSNISSTPGGDVMLLFNFLSLSHFNS